MKIYFTHVKQNNIKEIEMCLQTLYKKQNKYQNIYSDNGIFRIQNNNIYKLVPEDISPEKFEYKNINFILDKSKYIFRKDTYCIPYDHIVYNIEQREYNLNIKSKLSLIIEYTDNLIDGERNITPDIYFYTNEEILCGNLKNNMIDYYSLFTNN